MSKLYCTRLHENFLTFSAALGNMSKLYCTRLHENWLRLGIARSNKFVGLCAHLAQTFFQKAKRTPMAAVRQKPRA